MSNKCGLVQAWETERYIQSLTPTSPKTPTTSYGGSVTSSSSGSSAGGGEFVSAIFVLGIGLFILGLIIEAVTWYMNNWIVVTPVFLSFVLVPVIFLIKSKYDFPAFPLELILFGNIYWLIFYTISSDVVHEYFLILAFTASVSGAVFSLISTIKISFKNKSLICRSKCSNLFMNACAYSVICVFLICFVGAFPWLIHTVAISLFEYQGLNSIFVSYAKFIQNYWILCLAIPTILSFNFELSFLRVSK